MKTNKFILLSSVFVLVLFAFFSMGAQPARQIKPVYAISYESVEAPKQAKSVKEDAKKAPDCCEDECSEDCEENQINKTDKSNKGKPEKEKGGMFKKQIKKDNGSERQENRKEVR